MIELAQIETLVGKIPESPGGDRSIGTYDGGLHANWKLRKPGSRSKHGRNGTRQGACGARGAALLGAISISSVVTREGQAVFEGISKSWKAGKRLRL